jgi:hypothetical protein
MAAKGVTVQRDELVEEQLRGIREDLGELKSSLQLVSANLDSVRIAELASIRANINDLRIANQAELGRHDAELKLLRYQMGRTTAVWSLVSSGVASAVVAAVMALVMRR